MLKLRPSRSAFGCGIWIRAGESLTKLIRVYYYVDLLFVIALISKAHLHVFYNHVELGVILTLEAFQTINPIDF